MNTILEDMSEQELLQHIRDNATGGHMSYEAARQVLLTRAMSKVADEVSKFNRSSSILAWAMIILTVLIGCLTAAQVYLSVCQ